MSEPQAQILSDLTFVYGPAVAAELWPHLQAVLQRFQAAYPKLSSAASPPDQRVTERDVVLITYGDQIQEPGKPPLQTLDDTLTRLAAPLSTPSISAVLPLFVRRRFLGRRLSCGQPELGNLAG